MSFPQQFLPQCTLSKTQVVAALGEDVRGVTDVLLPVLDAMAKRVVVAELETIRLHQAKLTKIESRLVAVRVQGAGGGGEGRWARAWLAWGGCLRGCLLALVVPREPCGSAWGRHAVHWAPRQGPWELRQAASPRLTSPRRAPRCRRS